MKTANRHQGAHETAHRGGDHSLAGEVGALRDSVSQLGTDVSEVMHSAVSVGQAGAEAVRETAASALDGVSQQVAALKEKTVQSGQSVGKQMGAHPFASAAIAFGAGYIFAKFASRK